MARLGLLSLLIAALVLAGCTGDSQPTTQPSSTVPVGSTTYEGDSEAGSISGTVTDAELLPIRGVQIAIVELNINVLTGEAGNFEFQNVPLGEYRVGASKLGYSSAFKKVSVLEDNATVRVDFMIDPIVIVESFMTTTIYNGKISCGILLVPVCGIMQDVPVNPTDEKWIFNWTYTTKDPPVMMITEMDWKATVPGTAQKLLPSFLIDGRIAQSVSGSSPIRMESDEDRMKDWFKKTKRLGVYPELADPVVDQRFTIYRSDFWGTPPPEGWTVYPS